jgi:hypothetical protein
MRTLIFCAICALDLCVSTAASAQNWGDKSARLDLGMTEQQVMTAVGYRPNKVEMQTCGQNSAGGAWTCKKYTYGNLYDGLVVYFSQSPDGSWRANNWDVYP